LRQHHDATGPVSKPLKHIRCSSLSARLLPCWLGPSTDVSHSSRQPTQLPCRSFVADVAVSVLIYCFLAATTRVGYRPTTLNRTANIPPCQHGLGKIDSSYRMVTDAPKLLLTWPGAAQRPRRAVRPGRNVYSVRGAKGAAGANDSQRSDHDA
jgi:hypothetical protein